MTSTAHRPPEPIDHELADLPEWCAFARAHRDELIDDYGSIRDALQEAFDGNLLAIVKGRLRRIRFKDH